MLESRELVVVVRQEAPNGSTATIEAAEHTGLQAARPQEHWRTQAQAQAQAPTSRLRKTEVPDEGVMGAS